MSDFALRISREEQERERLSRVIDDLQQANAAARREINEKQEKLVETDSRYACVYSKLLSPASVHSKMSLSFILR
jgi:hypothetical protein